MFHCNGVSCCWNSNVICIDSTWVVWIFPVRRFNVEAYEAEVAKKASLALRDFKYACVGYSLYMDNKDSKHEQPGKRVELPFCHGFEVIPCHLLRLFCIVMRFFFLWFWNQLIHTLSSLRYLKATFVAYFLLCPLVLI